MILGGKYTYQSCLEIIPSKEVHLREQNKFLEENKNHVINHKGTFWDKFLDEQRKIYESKIWTCDLRIDVLYHLIWAN